jgi:hypothetical protein
MTKRKLKAEDAAKEQERREGRQFNVNAYQTIAPDLALELG